MDPTQTLADLLSALDAGERSDAQRAFAALQHWIAIGGFLPDVPVAMTLTRLDPEHCS